MPNVKHLQFSTTIAAPPDTVARLMTEPDSYREWTSAFAEGSHYEGSWETGRRIRFLSPSGEGIVAEIAEHRPNEFISIRHLGVIGPGGVEDTTSESVKAWTPAYENYTFTRLPEGTTLVVDQDVTPDWEAMMAESWPKALARLKTLCETGSETGRAG